jgi:hypothetical protein
MIFGSRNKNVFWIIIAGIFIVALIRMVPQAQAQHQKMQLGTSEILIENIEFSNNEPTEDETVTIYVTVRNNGYQSVNDLTVIIFVDCQEICNITGIDLNANESRTLMFNWTAQKWDHSVGAMSATNDTSLPQTWVEKKIYTEPKPIGEFQTIFMAFLSTLIVLSTMIIIPGIGDFFKANICKSNQLKKNQRT